MQSNKANSNVNAACSPVHGHLWGKKNATLHNSAGLVIVLWLPQNDVLHSSHTHSHICAFKTTPMSVSSLVDWNRLKP